MSTDLLLVLALAVGPALVMGLAASCHWLHTTRWLKPIGMYLLAVVLILWVIL